MAHPYKNAPNRQLWARAVSTTSWPNIFDQETAKFNISPCDKVATAGSCFAQRISRYLRSIGRNFVEYEAPHPLIPEADHEKLGYGRFSARYGNIYTIRQLRQLLETAMGQVVLQPKIEMSENGKYIDLLRPNFNTLGFTTLEEAIADRAFHLACVRQMVEDMDVFVFTLGLTEAWECTNDGTIFGTHPSVSLRTSSSHRVQPVNFGYDECWSDLAHCISLMKAVNPSLRIILTVSPVALAATHQDQHVLLSTSYSKAVLRAVAGTAAASYEDLDYFPSYELFAFSQSYGQFLADDLRDVNVRGVSNAMRLFERIYLSDNDQNPRDVSQDISRTSHSHMVTTLAAADNTDYAAVECDEAMNSLFD